MIKNRTILTIFHIMFFLCFFGYGSSTVDHGPQKADKLEDYHPFKSAEAKDRFLEAYDRRAKDWPVKSTTKMVKTGFGLTFVRISGPEDAPPLVLLHGAGGNSLQWIPNVESLSKNYQVFAVDIIDGGGRSIYTQPIQKADDLTSWLDQLFDGLHLKDRINLIGLSYGGWITSQYTLRFPHRLRKIVFLAPAGTVLPLSNEWIQRAIRCMQPEIEHTRSFVYWLMTDLVEKDDIGRQLADELVEESYLSIQSFKMKPMVNPVVLSNEQWRSIQIPALFLVGENEKIYPPHEAVERLNHVAPQIITKIIPQAGHDLSFVQAELVNSIILEFLKSEK